MAGNAHSMTDDLTKPTVFTDTFSVSHSSFFINSSSRISHLLPSALVSASQIFFYHRQLGVICSVIAAHNCSFALLSLHVYRYL